MTRLPNTWLRFRRSIASRRAARSALPAAGGGAEGRRKAIWPRASLFLGTIVLFSALTSINLLPNRVSLKLGQTSPREVRAPRSVIYVDTTETSRLQQAAMLGTAPVYDVDERAISRADRTSEQFFDRIDSERTSRRLIARPSGTAQAVADLHKQFGAIFTNTQLKYLLTAAPTTVQNLRVMAARVVDLVMQGSIRSVPEDLRHARDEAADYARRATASQTDAEIIRKVAAEAVRPNRIVNQVKTQAARALAARLVPPVSYHIAQGDRVIGAGEIVTQQHLDELTALGMLNPHLDLATGMAICLLAAAMVLLVVLYIARTLAGLYADFRRLALLSAIVLLSMLGLKIGATMLGSSFAGGQSLYLGMMSVASAGMLVSVLIDMNLAVLIVALLATQSGLLMNREIGFAVLTLMSGLVGIVAIGGSRSKNNLAVATCALAAANLALVWLVGLLVRDTPAELGTAALWAVASAVFAGFLFWIGILVFESLFGILTHSKLLELSSTDRPLLKQLCAVAPGTYAHSIMVGALAESGALAIGADPLLSRVGGYYHDIGKMKRPEFFAENQRRENVHGRLTASLSALIITAHVREGLELAAEHRLPAEIRDLIAQHHGTTLIRYFYNQALTDCGGAEDPPPGLEDRFRYPGPKPQTREAAILMLADTVEAAARCADQPTPERIQKLVETLVRAKVDDGQLDDCSVTLQDLKKVSDSFEHVLSAMFHNRVEYPQELPAAAVTSVRAGRSAPGRGVPGYAEVGVDSAPETDIAAPMILEAEVLYAREGPELPLAASEDERAAEGGGPLGPDGRRGTRRD